MIDDPLDLDDEGLLGELLDAVAPVAPSAALKARLLDSVRATHGFDRFAARIAALCDVALEQARALLDGLADPARWLPGPADGVSVFHIDAGPRLASAIVGFVKLQQGARFPTHAHLGTEVVLVLSGAFREDDGAVRGAGDEVRMEQGSRHGFVATRDLLYLVVAENGIDLDGEAVGPEDPRF